MCSTYWWYNVAIDIHSHHFISIIKHIELAPLWTYIQLFHQVTASPHASIDSLLIPARPLFIVLSWNLRWSYTARTRTALHLPPLPLTSSCKAISQPYSLFSPPTESDTPQQTRFLTPSSIVRILSPVSPYASVWSPPRPYIGTSATDRSARRSDRSCFKAKRESRFWHAVMVLSNQKTDSVWGSGEIEGCDRLQDSVFFKDLLVH